MTPDCRDPKGMLETLCSVHDAESTDRRYNRATRVGLACRTLSPAASAIQSFSLCVAL
jgi:hypothetical protein